MSENDNKKSFILGISIGIAVVAAIGFFVMLGLYVNPEESSADTVSAAVDNNPSQPSQPTPSAPQPSFVDVEVSDSDHFRGNANAPVTIVEFSDFECPYCSRFHDTMKQIVENYPDDVKWVYKHFPLDSIHQVARKAAEASECASDQDKFWEYADEVFVNQSGLTESKLSTIAGDIGLNTGQFDECLTSGKYTSKVEADYQQGIEYGVNGTPGNFINGQVVAGALPYEQIESMILDLL